MYVVRSVGENGGAEAVIITKANAFVERGHDVVICYTDKGKFPWTTRPLSPKVRTIDLHTPVFCKKGGLISHILRFPKLVLNIRSAIQRVVNKELPDVLISVGYNEKYAIPFVKCPRGHKMVKVREFHHASNHAKFHNVSIFRKAIIVLSNKFELKCLIPFYDKAFLLTNRDKHDNYSKNEQFDVVHNPLAIAEKDVVYLPHSQRDKIALFVGRLVEQKNIESLLRIWPKTERRGWKLKVVGDGVERANLEKLAKELEISDSVIFTGWCENPSTEMRNASLMCLTSRYEGFALVIVEGMAHGLPIVSYDLPYGPSDIIEHGRNGLLVPYLDEEMFCASII